MIRALVGTIAVFLFVTAPRPAQAQAEDSAQASANYRISLFLECSMHCDHEFLRTKLTSVNWVIDPGASDVHVLTTRLETGAGGSQVTLTFIGRNQLAGLVDTLRYATRPDASSDDSRRELLRVLQLGLVRYQLAAGDAQSLSVVTIDAPEGASSILPAKDPWNHWVFNVGVNGELNAESREVGYELGSDFSASRVTEALKVDLHVRGRIDRTEFKLDSGQTFTARRDNWNGSATVVASAGPHWSFGGTGSVHGSKPDNLNLRARIAPAVEWDLYPYAEATSRQLLFLYTVGLTHYDYVDETIYGKLAETRLDHELSAFFESRQPWGSARVSASASSFLDDWSKNRLSLRGGFDFRVARGLELDVNGSVSRVRDQISLRKGDASDQEVFLRLRELATDYEANIEIGLDFTFGSFFNTVVNPRLEEHFFFR